MGPDEFASLYERLRRPLYAFAATRVSPQGALDVVHETFEVVWAKRAIAPSDLDGQTAWCYGIARNKVLQELQRMKRKHHDNRFLTDLEASQASAPDDVADAACSTVDGQLLWRCLTADEQELVKTVVLTDVDGAGAAAALGISHAALRKRISRLRQKMARLGQSADAGRADEEVPGHE